MRRIVALFCLLAAPALADDVTTSGQIARDGLVATASQLSAAPDSPDRDMALGAVRFLHGVEGIYQARWRIGATDPLLPVPVLGTPLPANPHPGAMTPQMLTALALDLADAMRDSRDALPDAPAELVLDLRDLWLDVDADGTRSASEDLTALIGLPVAAEAGTQIRFDAADLHWLRAYTHLIEVATDLLLAFDAEPALAARNALQDQLRQQFSQPPGQMARAPNLDMQARAFGPLVDRAAVALQTLRTQPDPAGIRNAADNLRAMIVANRAFWQAVAAETDNDREWIPNDDQQAALGFDLPADAGRAWLAVLDDAEQLLDGRMLVPFWRFAPGYGVDLAMWIADPRPVDVIGWIQGSAALPYTRPGLTVGSENLDHFLRLFQGRGGLYMVLFN